MANDGGGGRGSFESSTRDVEARASTRRCKSPWKTRASSRLIRTVCKLKRVSVRFFFLLLFLFLLLLLLLLLVLLIRCAPTRVRFWVKRWSKYETWNCNTLATVGSVNNSTTVRDVYSLTGRSDRNETKSSPLLKEIFPDFLFTVLIGYKLIRARFLKLVRVCVWKTRRNKVGSKWLVMYRVIRKVWYIECIILIERKNLFDFFFFLMKGIDLDISIGRSFTIRWYKVIYFFDVIWICFICIADNLWSDKELLPLISQCYTY